MRRINWSIVALGLLMLTAVFLTVEAADPIPEQVLDYYDTSVYRVTTDDGGGSAFHIAPTFLLTNAHVVSEAKWVELNSATRPRVLPVEVVAVDEYLDLALLYCKICERYEHVVPVMEDRVYPMGMASYGGGYGLGEYIIHEGQLGAMSIVLPGSQTTNVPSIHGDSGSPAIAIIDGEVVLVGVRSGARITYINFPTHRTPQFVVHLGLNITPNWVHYFLNETLYKE